MNRKVLTVFLVGLAVLGLLFMVACPSQAPKEDQPAPPPTGKEPAPPPDKGEPGTPPDKGEPGKKPAHPGDTPVIHGKGEPPAESKPISKEPKKPGKPISGKVKIGLLLIHEDTGGIHSTLKEMEKNGEVEVVYEKLSENPKQHVKQAEKLMAKGVHGLIITPRDALYAEEIVLIAEKKDTPIFIMETITLKGDIVSLIAIDYKKIGEKAAKFMGKELGNKGKVLVLSTKASLDLENMAKDFKKEAEKSGMKVEIVTAVSDKLKIDKGIEQALKGHKDVQGVFAVDTDLAMKAAKKMSAMKMDASLVGYGSGPDIEKAILKYKFYKGNIMADTGTMGEKAAEVALKYLKDGKKVPRRVSPEIKIIDKKEVKKKMPSQKPPKEEKPPGDKGKKAPPKKK